MPRIVKVYNAMALLKLIIPVSICMIFVILNVKLQDFCENSNETPVLVLGLYKAYEFYEPPTKTIVIILTLIILTAAGTAVYYLKWYKYIQIHCFLMDCALVFGVFSFHLQKVLTALNLPLSIFTVFFVVYNIGCFVMLALHWKTPKRILQGSLIFLSSMNTLFIFYVLPDWTVWPALLSMSLWDLFAVLAPCGPLRWLARISARRGDPNLRSTLYVSMLEPLDMTPRSEGTEMTELPSTSRTRAESDDQEETDGVIIISPAVKMGPISYQHKPVIEEYGTINLGLGDFIFYSLMIANTVKTTNSLTTIACLISNVSGLLIILPIVSLLQKPLPALPFPLFCASFFYFSSHIALTPFTDTYFGKLIVI